MPKDDRHPRTLDEGNPPGRMPHVDDPSPASRKGNANK
jgi:hypothetical protein